MKTNNFIYFGIGLFFGALVTALLCNCFDKNTDSVTFVTPQSIDSSSAMNLSNMYRSKLGNNTCDFKYSIVISNEQYEALKATEKLLIANNKIENVSGFRIFYGITNQTDQIIKSFVFPMSNQLAYFDPNGKVYSVQLTHDKFALPCPQFCN